MKTNKPISRIIENYFIELRKQNTTTLPKDLEELYGIFEGTDVPDKKELRRMFFEDAVIEASSVDKKAEYILTRNIKDFKKSIINAITPEELLEILKKE